MFDSSFDSFNEPFYPPNYGIGMGCNPFLYYSPPFEQLWLGGNNWLGPRNIIFNILDEPEKNFTSRRLNKSGNRFYMRERSGREINIGELEIFKQLIINPKPDGTFDAFRCTARFNDKPDSTEVTIPYKDFVKRNFLPYLSKFQRNPDCPDKYIIMAFCQALLDGDDTKFLELPKCSGWKKCGQMAIFTSSHAVIPQLEKYYAPDILERQLIGTDKKFADAADNLSKYIPNLWQYKLLLAIRVTSLLLYFYAEAGLNPDQLFVIEPKSESNAKAIVTILKNKNCNNTAVHSLTECKTALQKELNLMNDGMAVFRDSSFVEESRRRTAGLEVLLQELTGANGNEEERRHLIAIVADNAGNFSSELPAYFLSLNGCADVNDIQSLQQAIGEFDSSLINLLSCSKVDENLVTSVLAKTAFLTKTISNSEYYKTERMLRTTVEILFAYRLISDDERKEIIQYLKDHCTEGMDANLAMVNEFRKVLSSCIETGKIEIANQNSFPFFELDKPMVFLDAQYINMMTPTLDRCIMPMMRTTQKRNRLLEALESCDKLYANNSYKRNLEVEFADGSKDSVSVYSVPKSILTTKCREEVASLNHADYLFRTNEFPDGFVPIVSIGNNKVAGRIIDDTIDEAESIYVSGRTRSGKTHFLVQQAVIRAESGSKVIIFDQTGAFTDKELKKHLPDDVIRKYFSRWEIGKLGLPVDLLSLEHCTTPSEKKDKLCDILAEAGRITGDIQKKFLRRCLKKIIKAIDEGKIQSLPETLQFFNEDNPDEEEIKSRLEDVFDDLEELEVHHQNWKKFLDSQAKIVVISTSADGVHKNSQLIDMLLVDLYDYKQHDHEPSYTIVIDEIEDLNLAKDAPINSILRKGGKQHLSVLLASQEFSVEKDRLGKLIGNCGLRVFFHPKDANISIIAKHIECDKMTLAKLEQGEFVAEGGLYSHTQPKKNRRTTIKGTTYLWTGSKCKTSALDLFTWED